MDIWAGIPPCAIQRMVMRLRHSLSQHQIPGRISKLEKNAKKTEWHRLVAFGKMAEIIGKYCKTGIRLWVEGKLETSKYTDAQGITRYSTQIIVNNLIFLGDNNKNNGQQRPQNTSHPPQPQNGDYSNAYAAASGGTMAQHDSGNGNQWDGENLDDDIPF